MEWQDISTVGNQGVLVTAKGEYGNFREPITAFKDATGVWRLTGSIGGMSRLRFKPTHWRPLPPTP